MEKTTVYVESSIIGYLAGRTSGNLVVAAHQHLTNVWWREEKQFYELVTSQIVIQEAAAGNSDAARERLALLQEIPLLPLMESRHANLD